jgi:hypothetical protein
MKNLALLFVVALACLFIASFPSKAANLKKFDKICDRNDLHRALERASTLSESRLVTRSFYHCMNEVHKENQSVQTSNAKNSKSKTESTQRDTKAPELVSLTIDQQYIDVNEGAEFIDLTLVVKEEGSGPDFAYVDFYSPDLDGNNQHISVYFEADKWNKTRNQNEYTQTRSVEITTNAIPGIWAISVNTISDKSFNYLNWISSDQLRNLGSSAEFEVANDAELDLSPPELIDLSYSLNDIDVTNGDVSLFFTATVKDYGSEPNYMYLSVSAPEDDIQDRNKTIFFDEHNGRGWEPAGEPDTYTMTRSITFRTTDPSGIWNIAFEYAEDKNGNQLNIYNANPNDPKFNFNFETQIVIINDKVLDLDAPKLRSLTFETIYNGAEPEQRKITVEVEEASDIEYMTLTFMSPSQDWQSNKHIDFKDWVRIGSSNRLRATETFDVAPSDETGIWPISINVDDTQDNYAYYDAYALTILGFDGYLLNQVDIDKLPDYQVSGDELVFTKVNEEIQSQFVISKRNLPEDTNQAFLVFELSDGLGLRSYSFQSESDVNVDCYNREGEDYFCYINAADKDWETIHFEVGAIVKEAASHNIRVELSYTDYSNPEVMKDNNVLIQQIDTPRMPAVAGDYNGDGRADIAFRLAKNATSYSQGSQTGNKQQFRFGRSSDIPVNGDFDGDGIIDVAVRRPSEATWYAKLSTSGEVLVSYVGEQNDDIPVPADYDGDGITDFAVRRPSTGQFIIQFSSNDSIYTKRFGVQINDIPVVADYDGDGKSDIAIRRPSNATWYILESSTDLIRKIRFGLQASDIPVPHDYDGDGKADIAIRREGSSSWFIFNSADENIERVYFGTFKGGIPAVGDYDGDGKADIALRRPATFEWRIRESNNNFEERIVEFGSSSQAIPTLAPMHIIMKMLEEQSAVNSAPAVDSSIVRELPETAVSTWSYEMSH